MKELPSFIKDHSETLKVEEIIDYFISWTIRCCDAEFEESDLVNTYSKLIVSKLIYDDENLLANKEIRNVKTWKQFQNIDVWAEFEIDENSKKTALIIENKMYSSIRQNQLSRYKELANKYYAENNEFEYDIYFIFIRPDYEHEVKFNEKEICVNEKYSYFNLEELQSVLPNIKTGNALFDEFWFNWK